jgi:hypothetical protein
MVMVINISEDDINSNPSLKQQMMFELKYDERLYKKTHNNLVEDYQDFQDWIEAHGIEHKFQSIIINQYLSNINGLKVYDLQLLLKQEHFLSDHNINLIIKHLITNNRFVEVDTEYQDARLYHIYKKPRVKEIEYPHCIWIPHPQNVNK